MNGERGGQAGHGLRDGPIHILNAHSTPAPSQCRSRAATVAVKANLRISHPPTRSRARTIRNFPSR